MLVAKLVVVGGDVEFDEIRLQLPAIIGRGRDAQITLAHPLVSRQHCELYELGDTLHVRDMGSMNGTFVGKEQVTERVLSPGELLTVGTVTFRAVYGNWSPDSANVLEDTTEISAAATKVDPSNEVDPDEPTEPVGQPAVADTLSQSD